MALMHNERTAPMLSGEIQPDGMRLLPSTVHASELFWRQLKFSEFDVSEMSVSSLCIATSIAPTEWVAIPVFTARHFFHTSVLVRKSAEHHEAERPARQSHRRARVSANVGRLEPRNLRRRVRRAAERQRLVHGAHAGEEPRRFDRLHRTARRRIPLHSAHDQHGRDDGASGELDATLLYITGRTTSSTAARVDLEGAQRHPHRSFPIRSPKRKRYYAKTGMFPINHTVVVRRSLYEREPWVARSLYDAFVERRRSIYAERDGNVEPFVADRACSMRGRAHGARERPDALRRRSPHAANWKRSRATTTNRASPNGSSASTNCSCLKR